MSIRKSLFEFFARGCKHSGEYRSWEDIGSVMLLFESDYQERNEEVKQIVKEMVAEGKRVCACGYVSKKKSESVQLDTYVILSKESYSITQRLKKDVLEGLRRDEFDVVIDLSPLDCYPMKYVLLSVDAKMRCGEKTDRGYYDLMIDLPERRMIEGENGDMIDLSYSRTRDLWEQIVRYLKMIQ